MNNILLNTWNTPHGTVPFDKIQISEYEQAFDAAIQLHTLEIQAITDNPEQPNFQNTIEALEYSGDRLDKISMVFFNLLEAESSDEMMDIAQRVQPKLTEHSNNIMLNADLFKKVKTVNNTVRTDLIRHPMTTLNKEQQRLLDKTVESFVDHGANLSPDDQAKYRELSNQLSTLTLNYGQNVLKATNEYSLLLTESTDIEGLPQDVLDVAEQKAKEKDKSGWLFDLSAPSYVPFMKYAANRNRRKELYMAYSTRAIGGEFDNIDNVKKIANTRLAIANLMGYATYADYVLRKRMATTTTNVLALLDELQDGFTPAARAEYCDVQAFAIEKTGKNQALLPYDWAYYSNQLKDSKFDLNDEMTRPYFELENVKKGVFGLATTLYGLTFKKNAEIPVYHEDVEAFEVFDGDGRFLAVLYTDFFPRAGKQPGAWMTEFQNQEIRNGEDIRPHVSLVMNFTKPTESKPALLTFDEVNTFLHEFGHALHGMLSDVTYPGQSGTHVYRDFVELPSQFMENFLLEKEYLDTFAVHYLTGEKIPPELVQKIRNAANFNVGYATLRQLAFARLDMAYHTIKQNYVSDIRLLEGEATLSTQVIPPVKGTMISPAFGHIFSGGYAAGYYSYKWAEVLDADAFALFKERGIFNPETAKSFRENILSQGGTADPMDLYLRFRGQKPTTEALKKRSGIV
jgi:peptidyl-dipeptidase Dcp